MKYVKRKIHIRLYNKVRKVKANVCCALTRTDCNICIHCFDCSCLDFAIKSTICKHIHSVNLNVEINDTMQHVVDTEEVANLVSKISNTSTNTPEELRFKVDSELSKFVAMYNSNNYSAEALTHLYNLLKTCNSVRSQSSENIFTQINKQSHPALSLIHI